MIRLTPRQLIVLIAPVASIVLFLTVAAGFQIHRWGLNWIWGAITLLLVGWRFLLVRWTRPPESGDETVIAPAAEMDSKDTDTALRSLLEAAKDDPPLWQDPGRFWERCQELLESIARAYYPDVPYPLLNIYVPQAYGLLRGTVEDTDRWMQQLSPLLNQITVGQAWQSYLTYQKLEPGLRRVWQVWNSAQWVLNPAAAAAKAASQRYSDRATEQLLFNLGRQFRETALKNLYRQAILLYSGGVAPRTPEIAPVKTATLEQIIARGESTSALAEKPLNILVVGRTGAGKSSLINTLFGSPRAEVDVLPSTDAIRVYRWKSVDGDTLTLWDSPGYEQANRSDFRALVLDRAAEADLLILVTPVLDPSLQMDLDFLKDAGGRIGDSPVIVCVTGVDRLRPVKEWQPPYDWLDGTRGKEIAIREATEYRSSLLGDHCDRIYPVVTEDRAAGRSAWGIEPLAFALIDTIEPAKGARLARFLRDREAKTIAAARIIERYAFGMSTTAGIAGFLKSPILGFISGLTTGNAGLAYLLAAQIPVERLPVVIGKLQLAYDLFKLFNGDGDRTFDIQTLWPVTLDEGESPDREARAFGHALVEYWTAPAMTVEELRGRYRYYLEREA